MKRSTSSMGEGNRKAGRAALLMLLAFVLVPGCSPDRPDRREKRKDRIAREARAAVEAVEAVEAQIAAPPSPAIVFSLTPQQRDDLLFPALREQPDTNPSPCVTTPGSGSAPLWLEQATAFPSCPPALRRIVQTEEVSGNTSAVLQDHLTAAALCNDHVSIRKLISSGADPNRHDSCGSTALVAAASARSARAMRALLAARASLELESRGSRSRTPLLAAAMSRNTGIAVALLAAGASPDATTRRGRNALMFAAANADAVLVRKLLGRHADVCHRDELGLTATKVARAYGSAQVIKLLRKPAHKCRHHRRGAR